MNPNYGISYGIPTYDQLYGGQVAQEHVTLASSTMASLGEIGASIATRKGTIALTTAGTLLLGAAGAAVESASAEAAAAPYSVSAEGGQVVQGTTTTEQTAWATVTLTGSAEVSSESQSSVTVVGPANKKYISNKAAKKTASPKLVCTDQIPKVVKGNKFCLNKGGDQVTQVYRKAPNGNLVYGTRTVTEKDKYWAWNGHKKAWENVTPRWDPVLGKWWHCDNTLGKEDAPRHGKKAPAPDKKYPKVGAVAEVGDEAQVSLDISVGGIALKADCGDAANAILTLPTMILHANAIATASADGKLVLSSDKKKQFETSANVEAAAKYYYYVNGGVVCGSSSKSTTTYETLPPTPTPTAPTPTPTETVTLPPTPTPTETVTLPPTPTPTEASKSPITSTSGTPSCNPDLGEVCSTPTASTVAMESNVGDAKVSVWKSLKNWVNDKSTVRDQRRSETYGSRSV